MEIGFCTWYFKQTSLEDLFAWGAEHNLSGVQLDDCPDDLPRLKALVKRFPQVRLHILGRCINYLAGTPAEREDRAALLRRDIEIASELGINLITVFAGRDPFKTTEENLPLWVDTFAPLVAKAEKYGVRLAFENCPQHVWWPTGGNLASTSELIRKLFELIPSPALGLNFDPSHYVWQGMNYRHAVQEFGGRIYSTHAKDTEIHEDVLADRGIYGNDWWHYRLPGWGKVDWGAFVTDLREVGYKGPVVIEHEDRFWNHNDDELRHGVLMAQRYLSQYDL
jgi:sugar phosphate isomerase/epimerase